MPELVEDVLRHGIYWLDYWFLFNLAGLIIVRVWLAPDATSALEGASPAWLRSWLLFLSLYTVNTVLVLLLDIMELTGETLAVATRSLIPVLTDSYFGDTWTVRLAMMLLLAVFTLWSMLSPPGKGRAVVAGQCLLILSFTYSATSHAANQGNFTGLQLAHWLHLLAAMAWAGAILGACRQFEVIREEQGSVRQFSMCLRRLTRLSVVAFVPALAGGLYVAWILLAGELSLQRDPYNRSLAIKLLFVLGMLGVAARLRFKHIPCLKKSTQSAQDELREVHSALRVDRAIVAMVLLMAADLTHQIPPVDLLESPMVE